MLVFGYIHHFARFNVQEPETPAAKAEYDIIGIDHRGQTDLPSGFTAL